MLLAPDAWPGNQLCPADGMAVVAQQQGEMNTGSVQALPWLEIVVDLLKCNIPPFILLP